MHTVGLGFIVISFIFAGGSYNISRVNIFIEGIFKYNHMEVMEVVRAEIRFAVNERADNRYK